MADHHVIEGIQRARVLCRTPHAVEILFAIRDGTRPPQPPSPDADPHAVAEAIGLLEQLGMIRSDHTDPADAQTRTSITTTGEEFATMLAQLDEVDQMLLTTPYAAEVLLGLANGVQPAQAVPAEADPREIAEAVRLLQRLQLIDPMNHGAG